MGYNGWLGPLNIAERPCFTIEREPREEDASVVYNEYYRH